MVERDEEGEFLYDPDEQSSSREMSPQALEQQEEEEEGGGGGFYERSPSSAPRRPEYDDDDEEAPKSKPRKRLVKKSGTRETHSPEETQQERRHRQEEEEEAEDYASSPVVRRKSKDREEGEIRKKVKKAKDTPVTGKKRKSAIGSSSSDKLARNTKGGVRNKGSDWEGSEFSTKKGAKEMKEMWDSVAGNGDDSEVRSSLSLSLSLSIIRVLRPLNCSSMFTSLARNGYSFGVRAFSCHSCSYRFVDSGVYVCNQIWLLFHLRIDNKPA